MNRFGTQRFGALSVLLLLSALPLAAQEVAATIEYLEGAVDIERAGVLEPADFGSTLDGEDLVITGPDGLAIVTLAGGTEIKLRGGTTVAIGSLGRGPGVELRAGGLFARTTRAVGGGRAFEVRTPTVVAGVRGTEFFVSYGRTIEEQPDIWLCVNEGSVEVEVIRTNQTTLVREGEGVNILGGTRATDPRFFQWTTELNWNFDADRGDVRDETDLDAAYDDLLDQDYD